MSQAYPDHPDFDYSREIDALRAERDQQWARQAWIAIVASEGWEDHDHIDQFIDAIAAKHPHAVLIVPERAVGGSKAVAERAEMQSFPTHRVRSEGQWGSNRQAVQASHIIRLADIVVVFWAGGSDLAKEVIDKAMTVHRPIRPDFGTGLHVYEMETKKERQRNGVNDKGKAKYTTKTVRTGKVIARTRKDRELVAA